MSLNLGNTCMNACAGLRSNISFVAFREGLAEVVHSKISVALDAPVEQRVEATAYARALRDVWQAVEAATLSLPQRTVTLPRARPDRVTGGSGGGVLTGTGTGTAASPAATTGVIA